jgi:hypothetical protein
LKQALKVETWFVPSLLMTAGLGVVATALMLTLGFSALPDPLFSLASWIVWTGLLSAFAVVFYVLSLMRAGEPAPIAKLKHNLQSQWPRYLVLQAGMALAGLDMYFFMILKPELNALFPFWADKLLAEIDYAIVGQDAWRMFEHLPLDFMAVVYTPIWFACIVTTLFWTMVRPASTSKSTCILSYFITWTIFGPIGQAVMSAAGPIFYNRLGLGDRFEGTDAPQWTRFASDYLWVHFEQRSLAPGAGISAMPSLHIASMVWAVLAFATFRSVWTIPAVLMLLYIYVGSIALRWHYVSDGLVGAVGAVCSFYLASALLRAKAGRSVPTAGVARAPV